MKTTDLIPQIKIASPCPARWTDMTGDEHCRFCAQCQKHVYNFSAMPAATVAELVKAREGRVCARFYRRADGTMLTADCPVGFRKYSRRLKLLAGAAVTLLMASFVVRAWASDDVAREKGPFAQKCELAILAVKDWLGLNPKPPVMLMGDICIVPNPPAPTSPAAPSTSPGSTNP